MTIANNLFYEFLLSLVFFIFLFISFHLFLDLKKDVFRRLIGLFFGYFIILIINLEIQLLDNLLMEFVFSLVIVFVCFEDKLIYKVMTFFFITVFGIWLEVIYQIFYSIISNKSYHFLYSNEVLYRLHIHLFHLIIVSLFYLAYIHVLRRKKFNLKKTPISILCIIMVVLIILTGFIYIADEYLGKIEYLDIGISSSFIIMTIVIAIISAFFILVSIQMHNLKCAEKKNNYLLKSMLKSKESYYIKVEALNGEMRKRTHDIVNQLIAIDLLLQEDNIKKAREYIGQMTENIITSQQKIRSGNDIFDAILTDKMNLAKKKEIEISFSGKVPEGEFIDYLDLCTICGNSIDNAIEATEKNDRLNKKIVMQSKVIKNHWHYLIKNPALEKVTTNNGRLISTKKDKSTHGFGVLNIRESVLRYNGQLDWSHENDFFSLSVIIKLS